MRLWPQEPRHQSPDQSVVVSSSAAGHGSTRRHGSPRRQRRSQLSVAAALVLVAAVIVAVSSLFSEPVAARSTGIIDYSGNPDAGEGSTCADCHGTNEPAPTVSIDLPETVVGGETIQVTVTIQGGPGVEAGFNASFADLAGEIDVAANDTRTQVDQITHTSPKTMDENGATFSFFWTAPNEAGTVALYAAGLSTNGDGSSLGDAVGTAVASIEVQPANVLGDVNCSGELNVVDALVVAQFDAGIRTDGGSCPLNDPTTELVAANGDVNVDETTNIVDALLIAQCDAGIDNGYCGNG